MHERFGNLRASSIPARLQLAALYSATSSHVAEGSQERMTGAQTAMRLLRQCWSSQPLSEDDLHHLRSVAALGGAYAPSLWVLAADTDASQQELGFLHAPLLPGAVIAASAPSALTQQQRDAVSSYLQQALPPNGNSSWPANLRLMLTPVEEQQSSGLQCTGTPLPEWLRRGLYQPVEVPPCPVLASAIPEAEARLADLVVMGSGTSGTSRATAPAYPLAVAGSGSGSSTLAAEMHGELRSSWEAHHTAPRHEGNVPDAAASIEQERVSKRYCKPAVGGSTWDCIRLCALCASIQ